MYSMGLFNMADEEVIENVYANIRPPLSPPKGEEMEKII
jgi:hypothetical protein